MPKSVAKKGDVTLIPGTKFLSPAAGGVWAPQSPVKYGEHKKVKIKGVPAIFEASCTFKFVGVDPSGNVVQGDEKVELKAKKTKLTDSGKNMLVHGDEEKGDHGNTLKVVTTNLLKTD